MRDIPGVPYGLPMAYTGKGSGRPRTVPVVGSSADPTTLREKGPGGDITVYVT